MWLGCHLCHDSRLADASFGGKANGAFREHLPDLRDELVPADHIFGVNLSCHGTYPQSEFFVRQNNRTSLLSYVKILGCFRSVDFSGSPGDFLVGRIDLGGGPTTRISVGPAARAG
jgi:hypothetical protein